MTEPTVSVVIASRGRPEELKRCLTGVAQLQYPSFEVIVVADPPGISVAQTLPFAHDLKLEAFDTANISAARNVGISLAAGDLVAFIDDDAVPEPLWLRHLTAPAARPEVAAMGGYVRGRNGISFQWQGQSLDSDGSAHPLHLDPRHATVLHPPWGHGIKTEGTNMAFRRDTLIELGGFDTAYHYFLEETDLNLRLARAGHATAIAPLAEVHHRFAANDVRRADRTPRDLFQIGASWAVFQRKHARPQIQSAQWREIREGERRRLLSHMVAGRLDALSIGSMMRRLDQGYREGKDRSSRSEYLPARPATPFRPFPASTRQPHSMVSRPLRLRHDLAEAEDRVARGQIVTVLCLWPTTLFHSVEFTESGVWLQRGGVFGRSDRNQPLFQWTSRRERAEAERARIAPQRGYCDE